VSKWEATKGFFMKIWGAIKKLPGWAVMAGLLLISFCAYLVNSLLAAKRRSAIQRERLALETKKNELVEEAQSVHISAGSEIKKKYEDKIEVLDQEEEELNAKVAEGPVGIARAWKEHLSGGSE